MNPKTSKDDNNTFAQCYVFIVVTLIGGVLGYLCIQQGIFNIPDGIFFIEMIRGKEVPILIGLLLFVLVVQLISFIRPIDNKSAALLKGVLSDRDAAVNQALISEDILAEIVEHMPFGLFAKSIDDDYKYRIINKHAENVFGHRQEDMLGKDDFDFFSKEEATFFRNTDIGVIQSGKVVDIPCEQVTTSSGTMLAHTRKVPIFDKSGKPVMLLGIFEDITEKKQNEIELEKHREHLEEMVADRTKKLTEAIKKSEELNNLKSEFLATMSHEIRTPMSGILGMAELVQSANPSEQIRNYADTIINSGETLMNIINDILDFSKIEAKKMDIHAMPIDMLDLVDDVAMLYSIKARDKALELAVRYTPGTDQFVYADPLRMRQILGNLVSNAIKFTDSGHVAVIVEMDDRAKASGNDDIVHLKFSVSDTGIGLSNGAKSNIFEKFSQGDNSTTRKYGGTGLGLSISKSLVDMMGGDIGVDSVEGQGATFWFTVPVKKNLSSKATNNTKIPTLQGVRVLVVDDLPIVRELVCEQLGVAQMRCDMAVNGGDALDMVAKAVEEGDPYQMIIIDYLMPDMNGIMLAETIQKDKNISDICMIMLTAAGNPLANDEFNNKGFSAYLAKPVKNAVLVRSMGIVWERFKNGETDTLIRLDIGHSGHDKNKDFKIKIPGAKILIAEDNFVNQIFIKEVIESMDASCVIASNGEEAIYEVSKQSFDLIIMDCLMPVMDGFEATQQLCTMKKQGKVNADLPILALTANAMKGDRDKCLAAGMDDYLAKPVREKELKIAVYKWISKQKISLPDLRAVSADTDDVQDIEKEVKDKTLCILDGEAIDNARTILKDKYDEIVGVFIDNSWERIEEINKALTQRSIENIIRPAHSLKSTSNQMGAIGLSFAAKDIEYTAKAMNENAQNAPSDFDKMAEKLKELEALVSKTSEAFANMVV